MQTSLRLAAEVCFQEAYPESGHVNIIRLGILYSCFFPFCLLFRQSPFFQCFPEVLDWYLLSQMSPIWKLEFSYFFRFSCNGINSATLFVISSCLSPVSNRFRFFVPDSNCFFSVSSESSVALAYCPKLQCFFRLSLRVLLPSGIVVRRCRRLCIFVTYSLSS
jgi:hypothetical protein